MVDYKTPEESRIALSIDNVDNTSDADKPVSTAQAAALALKADGAAVSSVDNTSDADKPVSTAQQAALNAKADAVAMQTALDAKADDAEVSASFTQVYDGQIIARVGLSVDDLDKMISGFAFPITDDVGQVVGFNDAGGLVATGLELANGTGLDDLMSVYPLITDVDGNLLMSLDDGGIDLQMSPVLLERITSILADNSYIPVTEFAGVYPNLYNVRIGDGVTYGVLPFAGYTGEIFQLASQGTDAIPNATAPLAAIFTWGQSNAGNVSGPNEPEPVTGQLFPAHSLALNGIHAVEGSTTVTQEQASGLSSLSEPVTANNGQLPAGLMGFALPRIASHYGARNSGVVFSTSYKGSTALDAMRFNDPTNNIMNNMREQAKAVKRLADVYGRTVAPKFLLIQGEAGPDVGWQAELESIEAAELAAISGETGSVAPQVFVAQINTSVSQSGEDGSAYEALQWARDNLDVNHAMTGPMYDQPLTDTIHSDNLGRMLGAEVAALAYYWTVEKARIWHPLWPTSGGVTRAGAVITIPMELPPPFATSKLRFDRDWIAQIANEGFDYNDDSASSPTIQSVEIQGLNIVVTLSSDPASATNKTITYGGKNLTQTTGWAGCRGTLHADSGVPSPFYADGHAVPSTIKLRCVRFKELLS